MLRHATFLLLSCTLAITCSGQTPGQSSSGVPPQKEAAKLPETRNTPAMRELTRADVEAFLDGYMPTAMERGDVAGAVVVVVKDGQMLFEKGYGYADVAKHSPVDPEKTMFRTGSVAKLFTWTAVMQLVEQGKIDLDRDVNDYLDFKIPPREGKPITMRNLMTHTPGFEERAKDLMIYDPSELPGLRAFLTAWVPTRIFPPGEVPAYSNYGAALAGYIVERVSGEKFDDYIERHIFGPLGMTNSTFRQPLPEQFRAQMSQGYEAGSGDTKPYELVGPAPAGSMAGSGGDMARFMIAHLQNGTYGEAHILQPETARKMHNTALPIIPPLSSMWLGFFQKNNLSGWVVSHDGDTQFFHTSLILFMDHNVGFYFAENSLGKAGAAGPVRENLVQEFSDRYFPRAEDTRVVDAKTAAEDARLITGRYESSRRAQTTFFGAEGLFGQIKLLANEDGTVWSPMLLGANGQPKKWREVAQYVWHEEGGAQKLAAKVENGQVVMFSVDEISPFTVFQPIPWWKSSAWLEPLFVGGLMVLALTILGSPVTALVRRHYRVSTKFEGWEARYRLFTRIAAIASLAVVIGWATIFISGGSNLSVFASSLAPRIAILHIASLIAFVGAAVVSLLSLRATIGARRPWFATGWNALIAISNLGILWVAVVFSLIAFHNNY